MGETLKENEMNFSPTTFELDFFASAPRYYARFFLLDYNPDQLRDEAGRWATSPSSSYRAHANTLATMIANRPYMTMQMGSAGRKSFAASTAREIHNSEAVYRKDAHEVAYRVARKAGYSHLTSRQIANRAILEYTKQKAILQ